MQRLLVPPAVALLCHPALTDPSALGKASRRAKETPKILGIPQASGVGVETPCIGGFLRGGSPPQPISPMQEKKTATSQLRNWRGMSAILACGGVIVSKRRVSIPAEAVAEGIAVKPVDAEGIAVMPADVKTGIRIFVALLLLFILVSAMVSGNPTEIAEALELFVIWWVARRALNGNQELQGKRA
ncbi:unnamed protein product [Polarella glacialis]|uniref:Uncharacterized protein n=1 Tax=Polarella glacialis TaxID=89957 RepID=A0A813FAG6_POLGL|nr:unnamed protein product [Polarella glacialis]